MGVGAHEGAPAPDPLQQAHEGHLLDGLVGGDAGDGELLGQLRLRGNLAAHRVFSAADLFRDIMLDFHITGGGVLLAVHTDDLPLGSVSNVEAKMVGPFSHKYYMASTEFVNTGGANLYIFLQICIEFIGLRRESGGKGFLSGGFVLQYIATI